MNYKELMIKSLTDLLNDGETLLYPIYGILNQGNEQYYAYFGFAGNDLLIALLSGKQISYTTRIPLDIKSVKIKPTMIFKQYIIDISFLEGASCKITASSKVFTIDSQKENMPLFLEYLKSKTPKLQKTKLKNIEGPKIRRQYFNIFLYIMLAFYPMPTILIILSEFKNADFIISELTKILFTTGMIWLVFLIPLIILSILNRFFFGKIVSVFKEDGLVLENDVVRWNNIDEITYCPRISSKFKINYNFAKVSVNEPNKLAYTIDIIHFPLYALKKAKKHNSEIKVKIDKEGISVILFVALLPTVMAILASLFL